MIKLKSLLEVKVTRKDLENPMFMSGLYMGVQDKKQGERRSLKGYPEDFVRGYKTVGHESWWDRANTALTNWAAQFGKSYGPR